MLPCPRRGAWLSQLPPLFSARPRVWEKLLQALPGQRQGCIGLRAATAGTCGKDSRADGQGTARGMPPLKAGMQAGEQDHDQPRSARPLHRASLPHRPDLLLSGTDPGQGYPSGLGGTWVSRRSRARQWPHVVAQHQQNPSPAAPGLSQAVRGSGQIPKGGSEPGCRSLGWQGRHGQRGDSLLRPRGFSPSQGSLCNFEFKGERGFLASSGLQMHASSQGILNPYSMCTEHMGKCRAPELHVHKGSI